ncbi:hypothetical protein HNQ96_006347 [Aminobacter lissarensis]|uniref:Uncharacterized protein n=1 Tax=Aminobacter carboxidus TaxID=376165 RepID=A0A8E1WMA4_9HYPH|nr:hypothetical protein [Aminobacter lissarensis]
MQGHAVGIQLAFWLAAAGVAVSLVFVMALPKKPA